MMNGFEYAGVDAILAGSFRAAIYCRLSKDDDLDGESASIANQRDMLETYCEKQGWEVVAVYHENNENNPQFDENKLVFRCFTLQGRKK